jgi:type IV pilus assembly protein PilQ
MKPYRPFRLLLLLCLMSSLPLSLIAQLPERLARLEHKLDSLAAALPALNDSVNLSLRDVPLHAYVRAIGQAHRLNVFIENTPDQLMTHHLQDEAVKSVFLFLCKTYAYDIQLVGTILHFVPYEPLPELVVRPPLSIRYQDSLLYLDLQDDSLLRVLRRIGELTGETLLAPQILERKVRLFLPGKPLELGLELLAKASGLRLRRNRKGYFVFEGNNIPGPLPSLQQGKGYVQVETYPASEGPFLQILAEKASLGALIRELFEQAGEDYFLFEEPEHELTARLEAARLEEVLGQVLLGTDFTFRKQGEVYLIGPASQADFQAVEIVELRHRPTRHALELVPGLEPMGRSQPEPSFPGGQPTVQAEGPEVQPRYQVDGVALVEYPELNRIILRGPPGRLRSLVEFFRAIDQPIPMVKVEMLVVEVNKNAALNAGIRAGLGQPADSSRQSLLPGLDFQMDGQGINRLLQASPSPFLQSLGRLRPQVYLQLQAQEARGQLEIRMNPVLSMLNGREATLTIGQTQYYLLETTTSTNGAVNNFQQFSQQFTEIEANISLRIRPFVSEDQMVTLDIAPDFSTPVGGFRPGIPPTIATRQFESSIRVRHGETFILGGLSQQEKTRNRQGLPGLSRIPVLRWFFGNQNKNRSETSLLIYVTPYIYYR